MVDGAVSSTNRISLLSTHATRTRPDYRRRQTNLHLIEFTVSVLQNWLASILICLMGTCIVPCRTSPKNKAKTSTLRTYFEIVDELMKTFGDKNWFIPQMCIFGRKAGRYFTGIVSYLYITEVILSPSPSLWNIQCPYTVKPANKDPLSKERIPNKDE